MRELRKHPDFLRIEDMAGRPLAILIGATPPPSYEQTRVEHVLLGGEMLVQAIGQARKKRQGEILSFEKDLETLSKAHASGELLRLIQSDGSASVLIQRLGRAKYAAPDRDGRLFTAEIELVQVEA